MNQVRKRRKKTLEK